MKINTLLGIIAITLFGISCDNGSSSEKSSNSITDSLTTNQVDTNSIKTIIVEATYESATVYAGATDYYFKNIETEAIIEFRNSNYEEEEVSVEIPDNMLEETEEGPSEANGKLVGKVFLIHVIDEVITKVELK
jgi:hypothetical protein